MVHVFLRLKNGSGATATVGEDDGNPDPGFSMLARTEAESGLEVAVAVWGEASCGVTGAAVSGEDGGWPGVDGGLAIGSDFTIGVWGRDGPSNLAGARLDSFGSGVLAVSGSGSLVSEGAGAGVGAGSGCTGGAIGAAVDLAGAGAGGWFTGGEVSKGAVLVFS